VIAALRRLPRLVLLAAHLVSGVALALFALPLTGEPARDRIIARWSRRLLAILRVRIHIEASPALPDGALLVCNHVSWIDIYLILAARRVRFVSKSEVRRWPVIGWLAQRVGTLFLERGRRADTRRINAEMGALMQTGHWVAVFPEGTTSDGRSLRRFLPSLLQPAVALDCPVVPAALCYRTPDGRYSVAPAYIDDISLWTSVTRILDAGGLVAELRFGAPIPPDGHRRELAAAAERAVAGLLGAVPARGTPPDTRPTGGLGAVPARGTPPDTRPTGGLGAVPAGSPRQTPADPPAAPR
jgi:1-acyl-sn-glycerol-3-phosphate acyltransferase